MAESKARIIEADMMTGNFDPTLKKYKEEYKVADRITVVDLFAKFMAWKEKRLYARTMDKYKACHRHIRQFFATRAAVSIGEKDVEKFRREYLVSQQPDTVKTYIGYLKACWQWAIVQDILTENPWSEVVVKVPPKQKPQPLYRDEVVKVMEAFRRHRYYGYYADFVEFLLGTGMRIGEAIGLRWCHVSEDCKRVWIGEVISRGGIRKETKTNRDRTLVMTSRLQALLQRRKAEAKGELVFPAPKGGPLDDHNFRNRAWRAVLASAGIPYRKPYITRSTMISHALAQGINPVEVAELTGHEVEILYKNYAGFIDATPKLPELWE
ncbi:tyrosine-type recombinase/integrase [Leptolyngbya sp. FACHB-16]|uniref:tyrosine-type recombinase/integrase n=1 Tax=unclassified Leptolyngbya TaxID=2650499 RepID=UPI00321FD9D8